MTPIQCPVKYTEADLKPDRYVQYLTSGMHGNRQLRWEEPDPRLKPGTFMPGLKNADIYALSHAASPVQRQSSFTPKFNIFLENIIRLPSLLWHNVRRCPDPPQKTGP